MDSSPWRDVDRLPVRNLSELTDGASGARVVGVGDEIVDGKRQRIMWLELEDGSRWWSIAWGQQPPVGATLTIARQHGRLTLPWRTLLVLRWTTRHPWLWKFIGPAFGWWWLDRWRRVLGRD